MGLELVLWLYHSSLSIPADHNVQVVVGLISLINDYRILQGRFPLGWLNLGFMAPTLRASMTLSGK